MAKTSNGGFWWETLSSGVTENLNAVQFVTDSIGYVVGENGTILKTIDGGDNWSTQSSGTTTKLRSCFFTSLDTGFVVGGNFMLNESVLLKTVDGGNNWAIDSIGSVNELSSIYFINEDIGFICGGLGTLYKTTTGGVVSVETNQNQVSLNFTLGQNYPNPFNPTTSINYELGNGNYGKAKLKIFNTLGKKIKDFNLTEPVGSVVWNGTNEFGKNVSSGTYFYRIETPNEFSKTQKMILLK